MSFDELSESVYEDLDGHIVTVSNDGKTYRIIFECDDWCGQERRRRFELIFQDVAEANATPSTCEYLHIVDEHPLLWQHNDESVSMFFSSALSEPQSLLGQLYEAHEALFGGWRKLSDYWYASSGLLRTGYGLLAEGPRRVIEEYARVVGDSLRYSIIHRHSPRGKYRVVLLNDCYVVCSSVSVNEQELSV
ncbi:MAG: hypothetical protein JNJ77_04800 [Planctomycetia bacterium]|nr:hypothetical protein [Planctomycetia bacterium]